MILMKKIKGFSRKSLKSHRPYRNSFHRSIFPVLFVTQLFGLFPVQGISGPHTLQLGFKWISLRTFYSCIFITMGVLMILLEINSRQDTAITAKNLAGLIFYMITILTSIIMFRVARKWRSIMMFWERKEMIFLRAPYKQTNNLRRKIILSGSVLFLTGAAEHALAKASGFYGYNAEATFCNDTVKNRFRYYATREYFHVFQVFEYHPGIPIAFWIISASLTYAWSFLDYFIIMISLGITERFHQINEYLSETFSSSSTKLAQPEFWKLIRYHFGFACEILEHVDENVSSIIIVSCLSNLYFICLQVLNITVKLPYTINVVYFWFSLGFLICRTCAVFLCTAEVNEQAEKPLDIIRHLPNSVWNVDIERLADQIRTQTVALSGMKFFYMTRRLLFGMMGTIITYEIVMMQNDTSSKNPYRIVCLNIFG